MVVIIFDLETSGLNPYHDDIIEIGAKVLNTDNSFQCLVKPKSNRPISQKITEITTISNRLLRAEGKDWLSAYSEFYNWLQEATKFSQNVSIVSHNGDTFDFVFFKRMMKELNENGTDTSKINLDTIHFHDTLPLSKRLFENRSYYNQPSLARMFNFMVINAHRAMGDVLILEQIYPELMKNLESQIKIDPINNPSIVRDYIDLKI